MYLLCYYYQKITQVGKNIMKAIYLTDYKAPEFTISNCDLVFELFEDYTLVTNMMKITKQDLDSKDLILNTMDLELIELYLGEAKLSDNDYLITEDELKILNVPKSFTIIIINKIYPQNNTELEGLYKSGDIFCTQNEPEGFRSITPYLDRPDVMAIFKTTVLADKKKYPVLLSNGNLSTNFRLQDGRHGVTWDDPFPKPSYLFALVAGDLAVLKDKFITTSGKSVRLNIYTDKGNKDKCFHAMKSLKESMIWDQKKYAREYDLELYNIVAVDSFNMGAMENKGLNIFNSHYVLANEDTATDDDFMGIQSVIAHEYFHNWTGNRITCRDWFQLTLKEGLTVFRDQSFSADLNSKEVQRIEDVKALRDRQFIEDASPTAHPIQPSAYISINNFYTATVYEKGAEVIRMIHTLIGEENYRKATDLYFDTFDGQAVRTDDFLWAMSKASNYDLSAFELWYHQSGTPSLNVVESFEDSTYILTLTQKIPDTVDGSKQRPYYYPLKIALLDKEGNELLENTLIISKGEEKFKFDNLHSKPILSINRDFSAPVIINLQENNYAFLMKHDTNSFIKYESAQSFAVETIETIMKTDKIDENFLESFAYLLEADIDLSYKALLLELPSVSTLMQRQDTVDFDLIYKAKEKLLSKIANIYKEKLISIYQLNHKPKNTELDSTSMSQRAIKNRCLKILAALETQEIIKMTRLQYENSLTMTDRIVALDILENISVQDAELALSHFYTKYKDDSLVMNKYFSIISASHRDGTLDRVMALQNDELYDEKVPNLVRSLIGVFARNYKHFHAKDGHAYNFIANKIIDIDKINPQIASGLCGAFKIYEKLNKINKNIMQKELERIVSTQSISKNVYEIVSKILKI
ncbi:MAG: aminopeptidase N [Sulfurimonas sp.]|nr:MAG: aminopeptidase N [Sulfurimonas sp.]